MGRRLGSLAELRYPPFWIVLAFLALAAATPWFRPSEDDLVMLAEAPSTEPRVPDLPLLSNRSRDSARPAPDPTLGHPTGSTATLVSSTGEHPAEAVRGAWRLICQEGARAEWSVVEDDPETVRVVPGVPVVEGSPAESWHIQLVYTPVDVGRNRGYVLKFWARADQPRRVGCTVSQDHQPWNVLGSYATLELADEWRPYQLEFIATQDEPLARVQFDLAGDRGAIEIQRPELVAHPADASSGGPQP